MSKPSVAILGVGPSGLAAAQAVQNAAGVRPTLYATKPVKSTLYGCQFLHRPIPLVDAEIPTTLVEYKLAGMPGDYRVKVYGPNWHGSVSPEQFKGVVKAWDIRATYDWLWQNWMSSWSIGGHEASDFEPWYVNPQSLAEREAELRDRFDIIISTIPLPMLCLRRDEHQFVAEEIWAMGDAPGQEVPFDCPDDTVSCNGNKWPSWYRMSRIFGHTTVEWPGSIPKPPYEGVQRIRKPLWTDCDCFPWVDRLGRYGAWMKGVLVSDVYELAYLNTQNYQGNSIITNRKDWCYRCGRIAFQARTNDLANGTIYRCQTGHSWEVLDDARRDRTRAHMHD